MKIYVIYGRSDSYRDEAQQYAWIEGVFDSFEKAKTAFMTAFAKTRAYLGLAEGDFDPPVFRGHHAYVYLDGGDVERWLELEEAEVK